MLCCFNVFFVFCLLFLQWGGVGGVTTPVFLFGFQDSFFFNSAVSMVRYHSAMEWLAIIGSAKQIAYLRLFGR